jgi:hypothetical protein
MPKSPKLFAALLALCVAAALVLGASGGATARDLTKSTVKKIATKVVKKQAGSLSVATAATATNALALGGKAPSAYTDDTIRYSLVSTTPSGAKSFELGGLTPGATYDVHFHLIMGGSGTPSGACQIEIAGSTLQFGWGYGTVFTNAASWDNSAIVTAPNTGTISIVCFLTANVTTFANQPSFAEATQLDSVTSRVATASPGRPDGSPATSGEAPRP